MSTHNRHNPVVQSAGRRESRGRRRYGLVHKRGCQDDVPRLLNLSTSSLECAEAVTDGLRSQSDMALVVVLPESSWSTLAASKIPMTYNEEDINHDDNNARL